MANYSEITDRYYKEIGNILTRDKTNFDVVKAENGHVASLETHGVFFIGNKASEIRELLKDFPVPIRVSEVPNQDKIIIKIIVKECSYLHQSR